MLAGKMQHTVLMRRRALRERKRQRLLRRRLQIDEDKKNGAVGAVEKNNCLTMNGHQYCEQESAEQRLLNEDNSDTFTLEDKGVM
jgi:hypothetical protein